jgi:hypothetical protein
MRGTQKTEIRTKSSVRDEVPNEKRAQERLQPQDSHLEEERSLSRRGFLAGALTTGTLAAVSGLLGCAPQTSAPDGGQTGASGGGTGASVAANDWLGSEPQITDGDIKETLETEVLVIGGGTAGLFAACSAAESGAKVLVIDKYQSGGIRDDLGAANSRLQKEAGVTFGRQEILHEMYRYAAGHTKGELNLLWYDESGATLDWYEERLAERGVRMWLEQSAERDPVTYKHFQTGHSPEWPRDSENKQTLDGAAVLTDYAMGLGAEFLYNTPMRKLVKEGGRVVGAIAEGTDGYIRINASKGTLVCTGGYGSNMDMLNALQPQTVLNIGRNSAIPGSDGDGIKACIWAGARFDDIHTSMLFDRTALLPDQIAPALDGKMFWMGSQPFLKVNLRGKRFANESGTYDFILHAAQDEPDNTYCVIWDSKFQEDVVRFDSHGCSRMFPYDNGAPPNIPIQGVAGMIQGLIADGYVQQADSVEDLANKLNIPTDNFAATVKRYNDLFDMKDDPDFGKEPFRLSELRNPPYFGVRCTGYMLCTLDGIHIDTNINALDTEGNPISGLYVCGNDSGSYYAHTYPNLATGHACGRSITFARRAGKIAAEA